MSLLGFILLLGLTTPQNQPVAAQQSGVPPAQQFQLQVQHNLRIQVQQPPAQQFQLQVQPNLGILTQIQGRRLTPRAFEDANLCFAIRSYIFNRQDGNAPVLVSTTTCTPADTLRRLQVANPPRARLVPQ